MTTRPLIVLPPALAPLTQEKRWVVWKWVTGKNGKRTKPPFRADAPRKHANSTDPSTWCDLNTAMLVYTEGKADGVGFTLMNCNIAAIDLDDCRDPQTGKLHPWAADVVTRSGSYAEITPSGEGIRIIGLATGAKLHRKFNVTDGVSCELYRGGAERYICITGQQLGTTSKLTNIDALLDEQLAQLEQAKKETSKRTNGAGDAGGGKKRDLDSLIKDGCGTDFGGDRSRATWFVIHQLIKQGKSDDEIVAVLLDPANGISAHTLDQSNPEAYGRKQVAKARQSGTDTDAEIARLAKLSLLEYEQQRKQAAETLNVRGSILDRLVQAERDKLGLNKDDGGGKQGHAISFPEPLPWEHPVDGAALLDALAKAMRDHVVMPEHSADMVALWCVHTYLLGCFTVSPRLAIVSPTKRCGKTTALDVIGRLVLRPLPSANVSAAAVFRTIEAHAPCLLVDEADTFLQAETGDELRGVLNSGHRKGGAVLRVVGEALEPRSFSTFSAVAIAFIGRLPDTLHDRSIVITLKRRMASERIVPYRADRAGHLDTLARQAARWAKDHAAEIAELDPVMPAGVINREGDNLRALLGVADAAGGPWPERARQAAEKSRATDGDDREGLLEVLLTDIRAVFGERTEMASADLVKALVDLEGHPWAEMGKAAKPLTATKLARRLKPLGVAPKQIGPEKSRVRGYAFATFEEAFTRYLGEEGDSKVSSRPECDEIRTSDDSKVSSPESGWTVRKDEKPNNDGLLDTWTLRKGGQGENAPIQAADGGAEPGLSQWRIRELARWYLDRAEAQRQETGDVCSAELDAGLRQVLVEEVFPEFVEVEFERVMQVVFAGI
jgi:putative DNA primase/helicase